MAWRKLVQLRPLLFRGSSRAERLAVNQEVQVRFLPPERALEMDWQRPSKPQTEGSIPSGRTDLSSSGSGAWAPNPCGGSSTLPGETARPRRLDGRGPLPLKQKTRVRIPPRSLPLAPPADLVPTLRTLVTGVRLPQGPPARAPARSRLSYGRRGWGSTTTSHDRVSSNGRAAVLQTADGGSIPSTRTPCSRTHLERRAGCLPVEEGSIPFGGATATWPTSGRGSTSRTCPVPVRIRPSLSTPV